MRDIKFRAWDGHQMHYPSMVQMGFSGVSQDQAISFQPSNMGGGYITTTYFMQFTGLTDHNGAEVYEGDIVSDHAGVGEVKYSAKHAAFRVCYDDGMAKWFIDYILVGERESIEVIGNIYQNPELTP